ncbi:MAG: TraB/GumN family protein [bacterium]
MKKIIPLLLFSLVCVGSTQAQLLYEITSKNNKQSSYVFGTHHLVPISTLNEIEGLYRAYNDCNVVVGEFVMDENEVMNQMTRAAKMTERIDNLLSKEDYELVDSVLQAEMNLSLSQVSMLRPAMIQYMLEMTLYEKVFPNKDGDGSMDSYFQRVALFEGKANRGLETINDQIKLLFHSQSLERQAELLVESVRLSENITTEFETVNSLYLKGDIDGLYKLLFEPPYSTMNEGERFKMVDERNIDWMDKLCEYIESDRCFIAVGALHLPGENGLLQLLKDRGYKVKSVRK